MYKHGAAPDLRLALSAADGQACRSVSQVGRRSRRRGRPRGHAASDGGSHGVSYKLDGSENRHVMTSHDEEIVSVATASWNGDQLVILRATQYPDGRKIESRMTFALNAEGQLVRELIDTIDGKPQAPITVVARKK